MQRGAEKLLRAVKWSHQPYNEIHLLLLSPLWSPGSGVSWVQGANVVFLCFVVWCEVQSTHMYHLPTAYMMDNITNAQRVGLKAVLALVLGDYSTQSCPSLKWDLCISNSCRVSCTRVLPLFVLLWCCTPKSCEVICARLFASENVFKELVHLKMNLSSCLFKPIWLSLLCN